MTDSKTIDDLIGLKMEDSDSDRSVVEDHEEVQVGKVDLLLVGIEWVGSLLLLGGRWEVVRVGRVWEGESEEER
jgi:hypothetical protein